MRALSLHHVIARDATFADMIQAAHTLDCRHVCLFTQGAGPGFPFPVLQDHDIADVRKLMDDLGVSVLATTSFAMTPTIDVQTYAAGLDRSQRLGSEVANVRFLDDDHARVVDNFAKLGEIAGQRGIELSIEATGFQKTDAHDQALDVIRQAGRGKITIDPLHVIRTGTPLEALRQMGRDMIGYVQFCDGPLKSSKEQYAYESGNDRLPPGDGEYPLLEIIALIPPDAPISLEVPQEPARQRGVSILERCRLAVDGMRRLIECSPEKAA